MSEPAPRSFLVIGEDGIAARRAERGTLGGNRRSRIYGRLDCPRALAAIRRGPTYARHRVFFADESSAVRAGYRPCAVCLPVRYAEWRAAVPT